MQVCVMLMQTLNYKRGLSNSSKAVSYVLEKTPFDVDFGVTITQEREYLLNQINFEQKQTSFPKKCKCYWGEEFQRLALHYKFSPQREYIN